MLNSRNISSVLSQVLKPAPEITSLQPYSISLLSVSTKQPLVSCFQNTTRKETNGSSDNYIDANIAPSENIRILSLISLRLWNEKPDPEQDWLVIRFNSYLIYLYKINQEYLVMLCCDLQYPKVLAIKKLEKLSEYMRKEL
ncbi:hypothetical protein OGAPHI_005682 [Ogataea philodendri]|uniref:Uncharacterized protein n=1 Tax=Ogataea philodendri TaxID=1378263 RepID=A0A9P8NZ85_9ASCO|nr:uncharacterized protein OGAPHI_005682 [Ogataea philodendri]KAH3662430.1 hypothetical protein OGAPHI_005682 [Ogataea philodendri]